MGSTSNAQDTMGNSAEDHNTDMQKYQDMNTPGNGQTEAMF